MKPFTLVEKFSGDYGGPGEIVVEFTYEGRKRYVVAFKVKDGFGTFFHILSPGQLRERGNAES